LFVYETKQNRYRLIASLERERERERESNAKERRKWTETRETTKWAAEFTCLFGSHHLFFCFKFKFTIHRVGLFKVFLANLKN
jgi:hypothetical protein